MTFLEILEQYGKEVLGYPNEKLLTTLYTNSNNLDALVNTLLFEPVRSVKAPLGHVVTDTKGFYISEPSVYVPYIQIMLTVRYKKAYTIREAREKLESLGYSVSSQGQLGNIWDRIETRLGLKDKRRSLQVSADKTREKAKALGKQRITPYTEKKKKQFEAARDLKDTRDRLARLEKEKQLVLQKVGRIAAKRGMTNKEVLETREKKEIKRGKIAEAVEAATKQNKKILYQPTPKQEEFHSAGEDIVLYGGAAGGGKSYAMLIDALRYCMFEDYRALIIRRTSPMLKELIGVSRILYAKAFPGAKYNKSENVWYFPSGATIQFGYLDRPEDLENYQGIPYAYIGFDEIQHQRSDAGFVYLLSRLRSANPNIHCYIRASANPGGAPWVKQRFIDPAEPNTTFYKDGLSYKFIPASLADNPHLDTPKEGESMSPYRRMLMAMPEVQRKQLLEGDWTVGEDSMFTFVPDLHITDTMPPEHWAVSNALDYGYRDPAASLWAAVDPHTNQIIVYMEDEQVGLHHEAWGAHIKEKEGYIPQGIDRVIDHTVFNNTGHTGPGVREKLAKLHISPRPADRNREAGWNQIHQRLYRTPESGAVGLLVHSSCKRLIEQIQSAKINEKKPDDIDDKRIKSHGRVHHWDLLDCLRYLCMSRPSHVSIQERAMQHKTASSSFDQYRSYFQ